MMDSLDRTQSALAHAEQVTQIEKVMLTMEQAHCPVVHHFGPGVYIREVTIPTGVMAIGHYHKHPHMSIMLSGRLSIVNDDGSLTELVAPQTLHCAAGRKIAIIHETVIWQNVYATDETDVATLEQQLLEKNVNWTEHLLEKPKEDYAEDQEDFLSAITEYGFDTEMVRLLSENKTDQIPMPKGSYKIVIAESDREGKGMFATGDFLPEEPIAPGRIAGMRTPAGRYTNHSKNPNARFVLLDNDDVVLIANRVISGCSGGENGEEITIEYRQALSLAKEKLCQH